MGQLQPSVDASLDAVAVVAPEFGGTREIQAAEPRHSELWLLSLSSTRLAWTGLQRLANRAASRSAVANRCSFSIPGDTRSVMMLRTLALDAGSALR